MNSNHQIKKEYLVERLEDGARVLHRLFREAQRGEDPVKIARELRKEYELTENQKYLLKNVVTKLNKAKKRVGSLEEKFCIDKKGNFRKTRELYQYVYGKKPEGKVSARSFSFAIGFYLPGSSFEENELGLSQPQFQDLKTKGKLKVEGDTETRGISFLINDDEHIAKTHDGLLLAALVGSDNIRTRENTEQHELKHIMDQILGSDYKILEEFSTHLYSGGIDKDFRTGFNFDVLDVREKMINIGKRISRLEKMGAPESYIKDEKKKLEEQEDLLKRVKGVYQLGDRLMKLGLDKRELSMIVATTPIEKLKKRLGQLVKKRAKGPLKVFTF